MPLFNCSAFWSITLSIPPDKTFLITLSTIIVATFLEIWSIAIDCVILIAPPGGHVIFELLILKLRYWVPYTSVVTEFVIPVLIRVVRFCVKYDSDLLSKTPVFT